MATKPLSVKLTIEDAATFRQQLEAMASAGTASLAELQAAAAQLSTRFDELTARQAATKVAADQTQAAFATLRGQLDPAWQRLADYTKQQDLANEVLAKFPSLAAAATDVLARSTAAYEANEAAIAAKIAAQSKETAESQTSQAAQDALLATLARARTQYDQAGVAAEKMAAQEADLVTIIATIPESAAQAQAALDGLRQKQLDAAAAAQSAAAAQMKAAAQSAGYGTNLLLPDPDNAGAIKSASDSMAVFSSQLAALQGEFDPVGAKTAKLEEQFLRLADAEARLEAPSDQLIVELDTIILALDAVDPAVNAAQAALNQLIGIDLAAPFKSAAEAADVFNAAIDSGVAKIDPVVRASQQYAQALLDIQTIGTLAGMSEERMAQLTEQVTDAFANSAAVLGQTSTSVRSYAADLDAQRAAVDAVFASSKQYEQELQTISDVAQKCGLSAEWVTAKQAELTDAFAKTNSALGVNAQETELAAAALDKLRASIDPVYSRSQDYAAQLEAVNKLQAAGVYSAAQAEAAEIRLGTAFQNSLKHVDDYQGGMGRAANATQLLSIQLVQSASGLATGQNFFTVLVQQGHQVLDIMLFTGTGLKALGAQIASWAKSSVAWLIGPGGVYVAMAAVVVGLGLLAYNAEAQARQLNSVTDQLMLTRDGYSALGTVVKDATDDLAKLQGVSKSDALAAAQTAVASGMASSRSEVDRFGKTALDLSRVLNVTLPQAMDVLAKAYKNPEAAAQELVDKGLRTLSQYTVDHTIKDFQESGDKAAAFSVVLDAVKAATLGAADPSTDLQKALHNLATIFDGVGKSADGSKHSIGDLIDLLVVDLINSIATVLRGIQAAYDWAGAHMLGASDPTAGTTGTVQQRIAALGMPAAAVPTAVPSYLQGQQAALWPDVQTASSNVGFAGGSQLDPNFVAAVLSLEAQWSDKSQSWATSSTGRVGPMQVAPGTWGDITTQASNFPSGQGLTNIANPSQNVQGGAAYLGYLLQKYGDPFVAVLAYHDGPGAIDQILAASGGDAGNLTNMVSPAALAEANSVKALYSGSGTVKPTLADLAAGIAGKPGLGQSEIPVTTAPTITVTAPKFVPGANGELSDTKIKQLTDDAEKLANSLGGIPAQQDAIADQMDKIGDAMKYADIDKNEQQWMALSDALDVLQDRYNQIRTPQQQMIHDLQQQLDGSRGNTTVAQAFNQMLVDTQKRLEGTGIAFNASMFTDAWNLKAASFEQELDKSRAKIDQQTQSIRDTSAAWDDQAPSAQAALNHMEAVQQVSDKMLVTNKDYQTEVDALTASLNAQSRAQNDLKMHVEDLGTRDQITYLQAEISTLNMDGDARTALLAHMQAETNAREQGLGVITAEGQKNIALKDTLTALQIQYQRQQQVISDLSSMATQAFDTIGSAMANAFASGQQKAIDWGNTMRTVLAAVMQQIAKLALLNPVLNELLGGQHRTTIFDVLNQLNGSGTVVVGDQITGAGSAVNSSLSTTNAMIITGSAAAAYGGSGTTSSSTTTSSATGSNLLGTASNLASLGNNLGLGNALGITGPNSLMSDLGIGGSSSGSGGMFSGIGNTVTGWLNTPIYGTPAASQVGASAMYGGASQGGLATGAGTVSIGQALGGVGAGMAAGTLLNSLVGGKSTGGEIGSAVGAAIGTAAVALAPETLGISLIVGGLLGGSAGGLLGGLIGPGKPHHGWDVQTQSQNGQLVVVDQGSDKVDMSSTFAAIDAQISALNTALTSSGVKVTGSLVMGGNNAVPQPGDLLAAFPTLGFTSSSANVNTMLAQAFTGRTFPDMTTLTNALTAIGQLGPVFDQLGVTVTSVSQDLSKFTVSDASNPNLATALNTDLAGKSFTNTSDLIAEINTVTAFVNTTMPALVAATGDATSQYQTDIANINATYGAAETQAQAYGLSITDLAATQQKLIDKLNAARDEALGNELQTLQAAYDKATGANEASDLISYDLQAQQQRESLVSLWQQYYGEQYATQAGYVQQSQLLEQTLAAGRLQIQTQYAAQAASDAATAAAAQAQAVADAASAAATAAVNLASGLGTLTAAELSAVQEVQSAQISDLQARASLSSDPTVSNQLNEQADLAAFDQQASQQRTKLITDLITAFGAGYEKTSQYADQMTTLEQSLADQRLVIQKKYNDQAAQLAQQAAQAALQVANDNLSLQERAMTALGNSAGSALVSSLAQATTNRASLAAEGGNTALFDLVTAAETSQQNFSAAQTAYTTALQSNINTTQTQISTIQANTQALTTAADALRKFSASLDTSAASPLTPAQQLAAAQAAMQADITTAQDTTLDPATRAAAAQQLQTDAQTRLTLAQTYYGQATDAYATEYQAVKTSLAQVADGLSTGTDVQTQQLAVLNQQLTTMQAQLAAAQTIGQHTTASLDALAAAMEQAFANLQSSLGALQSGTSGGNPASAAQTAAQTLVTSLYQSILGRSPDAAGLADWTKAITSGSLTTAQVAAGIAGSPEAQHLAQAPTTDATQEVTALYQTLLGRAPDTAGLGAWVTALNTGSLSYDQVVQGFLNSPEYKKVHGLQAGGWVGNGIWNHDSVLARLAGGGAVALAGGEYVVNAAQAARYSDVLPSINRGSHPQRTGNDNAAMLTELQAMRAELAQLRAGQTRQTQVAAQAAVQQIAAVQDGTKIAKRQASQARRFSTR